jgi:hypothetical protein
MGYYPKKKEMRYLVDDKKDNTKDLQDYFLVEPVAPKLEKPKSEPSQKKSVKKEPKDAKDSDDEKESTHEEAKSTKRKEKGSKLMDGLNLSVEGLMEILNEEEKIDILYFAKKYIQDHRSNEPKK